MTTSDTPRTDALVSSFEFWDGAPRPLIDLSRTLERDLRECVELLAGVEQNVEAINPHWLLRVHALLARLKETL